MNNGTLWTGLRHSGPTVTTDSAAITFAVKGPGEIVGDATGGMIGLNGFELVEVVKENTE